MAANKARLGLAREVGVPKDGNGDSKQHNAQQACSRGNKLTRASDGHNVTITVHVERGRQGSVRRGEVGCRQARMRYRQSYPTVVMVMMHHHMPSAIVWKGLAGTQKISRCV